jgi:catechol 2,3-dioxygenase-like lactoylglutathione lyase family enzyme
MIDHLGLQVASYEKSKAFYKASLAPLGYTVIMEFDGSCGLDRDGKPDFWISAGGPTKPSLHIALTGDDRKTVDAFYTAALAAGGRDNGPPGLRVHYHPNYYGAFVFDLDGHNLEVVCHKPA